MIKPKLPIVIDSFECIRDYIEQQYRHRYRIWLRQQIINIIVLILVVSWTTIIITGIATRIALPQVPAYTLVRETRIADLPVITGQHIRPRRLTSICPVRQHFRRVACVTPVFHRRVSPIGCYPATRQIRPTSAKQQRDKE